MAKRVVLIDPAAEARGIYPAALAALEPLELRFEAERSRALELLSHESFDLAVLAIEPADSDGIEWLRQVRQVDPQLPVVVVASSPSVETAIACLRLGAGDYLTKPIVAADLLTGVTRLLSDRKRDDENTLLRRQIERPYSFDHLVGTSPAMQKVFGTIAQVADSDVDVLVIGDTGTGKELAARALHRRSRRADKPFVPVDCGAIPENLLESEFFGHERGAFTGADSRRIGLLEFADGGTFFLDEIGELPLLLQAKLLRTLQERKIRRVGGREEIDVDVRIVAATARDLEEMIRQKTFREDLYYRINVVRIDLPPLSRRGDDLGLLVEGFALRYSREMGKRVSGITPEAYQVLSQYSWPGNVRELQNVVRRGLALTQDAMIGLDDLPDDLVAAAGQHAAAGNGQRGYFQLREEFVAKFERDYLRTLLRQHHGNVKTAAAEAKLPRGTLYRLMKNHGLDGADFR
jgi:DNA-binding NtrC family response regulator